MNSNSASLGSQNPAPEHSESSLPAPHAARSGNRRSTRSEATRTHILNTARNLFNEYGTAAVSTNRIAAELGMSPGNLYYHYAGKRDIIRDLLAEMIAQYAQHWEQGGAGDQVPGLDHLRQGMLHGSELAWRYRFFGRELVALLRADAELATAYRQAYQHRMAQWSAAAEQLVQLGLLQPQSPLPDLTAAVWLVTENWFTFLEITGEADRPDRVSRQLEVVYAVLEPHLTPAARQLWKDRDRDEA